MADTKGPKRLALDSLLTNISLSLKDTILLITIVLTVSGSAWYYRDKINTLEEKVAVLEAVPSHETAIAVMQLKVDEACNDLDVVFEDMEELYGHLDGKLNKTRYRQNLQKIKTTFDNIRTSNSITFTNELN